MEIHQNDARALRELLSIPLNVLPEYRDDHTVQMRVGVILSAVDPSAWQRIYWL